MSYSPDAAYLYPLPPQLVQVTEPRARQTLHVRLPEDMVLSSTCPVPQQFVHMVVPNPLHLMHRSDVVPVG